MNSYIIGIDIGGTNTDAVLVDENQKLAGSVKTATTSDICSGFSNTLKKLLELTNVKAEAIKAISVGTTHATNAILQGQGLYKVGVIRIAGQKPDSIPSCFAWPDRLKNVIYAGTETISGGFDCKGSPITPFSESETIEAIHRLLEKGAESLAIIGVFSPMNSEQEKLAAMMVHNISGPQFPVTLSHQVGGIGFIERENTAILNSALKKVMAEGFANLECSKAQLGLHCPLYITQNNGSLIGLDQAIENPILTISAGPTNSFIGARLLGGVRDAIIVDVGGTSTDIGMIKNGYPKRSLNTSNIGGIPLNFSMPDVLSIAIGGGSHIKIDGDHAKLQIGPQSVGKDLFTQAMSFGGGQLTLTDAAMAAGDLEIAGALPEKAALTTDQAEMVMLKAIQTIQKHVKLMEGNPSDLPVLLVGGGAALFSKDKLDSRFVIPPFAHVANAYGSALAEIIGTADRVISLQDRNVALEALQQEAISQAISRGAGADNIQIVGLEIVPYHYTPGQMARVIVTASGKRDCIKKIVFKYNFML